MAYQCDVCKKKPLVGNKVSHSNIKTKIRKMPNLQRVKALIDGTARQIRVCTRCLRSNRVIKAPVRYRKTAKNFSVRASTSLT